MYVQITTRCNMHCEHCCYNCTADGEDMTPETFRAALALDDNITIGGGEPTLHPMFWQFLGEAIASCEFVWLATNGSQTSTALALAKLAQKGVIGCALSQDDYHAPIDERVVKAFTRTKKGYPSYDRDTNDCREIRNVTTHEINAGRCDFGSDGCVCPELHVNPDGTIKGCGCADAPYLGTVFDFKLPELWEPGECSHSQYEEA